ncbi:hypothetical protein BCON_0104g00140 [Botryotinia convoluta]|uniref:Uncharacterized protein n=1 Tax=Botryotinia convoluta TaxID=54673 RepID=A0A4Z1ID52_9HELO|nr:hypothetical protein BCON_0104g00140 [Botryotinia convoluta]
MSFKQAYWYSLKDDPYVIYISGYSEGGIAFQKDKTVKYIPFEDLRKEKWRYLGEFYGWRQDRFDWVLDKFLEGDNRARDNRRETAMDRTNTFLMFIRAKLSLKFVDNPWSQSILISYVERSSHQEKLAELGESYKKLKQRLEDLKKAGKDTTAASKSVERMKSSISTYKRQVNEEDAKIKKYKEEYEKEETKIAEESKKRKDQEEKAKIQEKKNYEIAEKKRLADWNRPLPRDATMWKGDYEPKDKRRGKH